MVDVADNMLGVLFIPSKVLSYSQKLFSSSFYGLLEINISAF